MGPDAASGAAGCLAIAGIEEEHLLNLAIIVPVVDGPIDVKVFVGLLKGFGHHVTSIVKSTEQGRWAAIIGGTVTHTDRTIDIKLQVKRATAHVAEVVVDAAHCTCCVEPVLIEHVVVEGHCLLIAIAESLVGELDQNHRGASTTGEFTCCFAHTARLDLCVCCAWCAHMFQCCAIGHLALLIGAALTSLMCQHIAAAQVRPFDASVAVTDAIGAHDRHLVARDIIM